MNIKQGILSFFDSMYFLMYLLMSYLSVNIPSLSFNTSDPSLLADEGNKMRLKSFEEN